MLEPRLLGAALDDDDRGNGVDPEALDELGTDVLVDDVEAERAVIPPALEYLREEALDAPAVPRPRRGEKEELRLHHPLAGDGYPGGRHGFLFPRRGDR